MFVQLSEEIPALLDDGKYQEALLLAKDKDVSQRLKDEAWDLVPHLCAYLTADNESYKPELIQTSEALLLHLSELSNPKELLLVLLEQEDCFKDDVKFITLLKPIQKCLLQIPKKRYHSLAIAFESIYPHLMTIDSPTLDSFEGKDRVLLDLDENVCRSNSNVDALLFFLEPFINEMSYKNNSEEVRKASQKQMKEILLFLIKILDKPLAYLDLTYESADETAPKAKSKSRCLGEKVLSMVHTLDANTVKVLHSSLMNNERVNHQKLKKKNGKKLPEDDDDELNDYDLEEPIPILGLSVLSYLNYGENLAIDSSPCVFTPEYILELNSVFVKSLLRSENNLVVEKGVILFQKLITAVPALSLSAAYLEHSDIKAMLEAAVEVICGGQVKHICQQCVKCFSGLLRCFTLPGRHRFFLFVFNSYSHSGLIGYTITLLKDNLNYNLSLSNPDPHFTGKQLDALLKHTLSLPQGEKSDFLESSEWIMGALNLLRFLVLRDKDNVTGIWDQLPTIEKSYFELLHKGIQISRAHYMLSLDQLKEGKKRGSDVSLTVSGESMPGLTLDQQRNVVEMALHTFDMMESILGRVTELIEQQRRTKIDAKEER